MVLHPFEKVEVRVIGVLEERVVSVAGILVRKRGKEVWQLGHDDCGLASGVALAYILGKKVNGTTLKNGMNLQATDERAKRRMLQR